MNVDDIRERYQSCMTPQERVLELLMKAVLDISLAQAAFRDKRFEEANRSLCGAQEIFDELRLSLLGTGGADGDAQRGAELFALLADELEAANVNLNLGRMEEVRQMTDRLRATYAVELGRVALDYRDAGKA